MENHRHESTPLYRHIEPEDETTASMGSPERQIENDPETGHLDSADTDTECFHFAVQVIQKDMANHTHVLLKKSFLSHIGALSSTEVKVYITVLLLANPETGWVIMPLKNLARLCRLSYNRTNQALLRLKEMKHLSYFSDRIRKESRIKVTDYLPMKTQASPNESVPHDRTHDLPPIPKRLSPGDRVIFDT